MLRLFVAFAVLLIFLVNGLNGLDDAHPWNYEKHGPDAWPYEFTNCRGAKQSPIDIQRDQLEYDANLKPFRFHNYDRDLFFNVTHNGHTVVVHKVPDEAQVDVHVGIDGSDLDSKFELLQYHFHWGYNNFQGSEHYIDGNKFPLELHLVHKSPTGAFTVAGFLFKISPTNNPNLDDFLVAVSAAKNQSHWQKVHLKLGSILPPASALTSYYRYSGSLTTPPCTEGIIWNVFTSHIDISSEQMESFRKNIVKLNFREPQRLKGRQVYSSVAVEAKHKTHHDESSAANSKTPQPPCATHSGALATHTRGAVAGYLTTLYSLIAAVISARALF